MRRSNRHARIWVCLAAVVAVSSAVLLSRAEHPSSSEPPTPALDHAIEPQVSAIEDPAEPRVVAATADPTPAATESR